MRYGGPERRRAERLRKQFTIRMRKISGNVAGDWDLILLRDISKSSLSFNYNRTLQEGDLLDLKISIGAAVEPIICRGETISVFACSSLCSKSSSPPLFIRNPTVPQLMP